MQDLQSHYQHAAASTKKLNFLGPDREQLPYSLWDPEIWTKPCPLGPAQNHKLVYVATDQHKQQQQIQMENLPSSAGWLTFRFLMLPVKEQLKHAPESCVVGPARMPDLVQKAKELLRKAHSVHVSGSPAAHGDARPDNIMVLVEAGNVKQLKLVDMDWAGITGSTHYPVLLNAKTVVWPEGVGPGQPLQQKHDIDLLQLQVNPATHASVNDWRQMFANGVQVSDMEVDF